MSPAAVSSLVLGTRNPHKVREFAQAVKRVLAMGHSQLSEGR